MQTSMQLRGCMAKMVPVFIFPYRNGFVKSTAPHQTVSKYWVTGKIMKVGARNSGDVNSLLAQTISISCSANIKCTFQSLCLRCGGVLCDLVRNFLCQIFSISICVFFPLLPFTPSTEYRVQSTKHRFHFALFSHGQSPKSEFIFTI